MVDDPRPPGSNNLWKCGTKIVFPVRDSDFLETIGFGDMAGVMSLCEHEVKIGISARDFYELEFKANPQRKYSFEYPSPLEYWLNFAQEYAEWLGL